MTFVIIEHHGARHRVALARTNSGVWVGWPGGAALVRSPKYQAHNAVTDDAVVAPMTGRIVEVRVRVGEVVEPEQVLVVLEAMKMEYRLTAGRVARVQAVSCQVAQLVDFGVTLVTLAD